MKGEAQRASRSDMMLVPIAALLIGALTPNYVPVQTNQTSHIEQSHGTVNIFLASGNTLVAVTDSMLTNPSTHEHATGTKLYKLDARTICAMAGAYSNNGAQELKNLALSVPAIAKEISESWARNGSLGSSQVSFENRASAAFKSFQFQLTSNLQALLADNAAIKIDESNPMIELTIAGYDNDGTLKIAEMTLVPLRTQSGVRFETIDRPHSSHVPTCWLAVAGKRTPIRPEGEDGFFVIFNVGNQLFCDVAGKPNKAEALLDNPTYAQELKDPKNTPSVDQLRKVAIDLERQTADDETRNRTFEVGGDVEVTALSDGKIVEDPPLLNAPNVGQSLRVSRYEEAEVTCNQNHPSEGISADFATPAQIATPPFSQLQVQMTGCTQPLDQIVFHDSTFTDSKLTYMGSDVPIFADTNKIIRSTLTLWTKC